MTSMLVIVALVLAVFYFTHNSVTLLCSRDAEASALSSRAVVLFSRF